MTMAGSWSHTPNDKYKPTNELVEKLVDIVSKGGNFLLNFGPDPNGELDSDAYDRLKGIGDWMKVNGEGIYGSRMNKAFNEGENIRFTKSKDGNTQYIFLFDFPAEGKINISKIDIPEKATITLLGGKKNLKWKKTQTGYEIMVPAELKSTTDHVWTLKISATK